ncbi:MAG: sarcosine oxidase subunit gamma [Boseongicola sp.]|nr:sarcosine oxidase subunit gamma [Boseongicola sp.]MDD9977470.1 sarcosine oxidase subunit gamma [Boseongicola sp.]
MSNPVSALQGAEYKGSVSVTESGPRGMITVRGDLSSTKLKNAATGVAGLDFPDERGANCVGERGICWMSPDELLVLLPYDDVEAAVGSMNKTLKGEHALIANVSDARASFRIEGDGSAIRDMLAKLTPADMRSTAIGTGEMRRTRLAQVPAAIWFHENNYCELVCFRSVAEYVFNLLKQSSASGAEVGHF